MKSVANLTHPPEVVILERLPDFSARVHDERALADDWFVNRFIAHDEKVGIGQPTSLTEGLTLAANEDAISLQPIFISHLRIPNVVMVPIAENGATWDLFVVWQRGKTAGPLRALLDALPKQSVK